MLLLIFSIILAVLSLIMVAVVMLQSGKSAGLSGAIAGGAETFLSKNKAKSLDAKLARGTKWVCAIWLVLTLVMVVLATANLTKDDDSISTSAPAVSESISAPVEGDASAPVEGDTSAPAEGDASAPVEGDTSAPAEGDASAPAEGEADTSAEVNE